MTINLITINHFCIYVIGVCMYFMFVNRIAKQFYPALEKLLGWLLCIALVGLIIIRIYLSIIQG
ncbi:hypothetical protein ACYATM_01060 [Lactobacillaceae bacterium Scapto_B20]